MIILLIALNVYKRVHPVVKVQKTKYYAWYECGNERKYMYKLFIG